VKGATTYERVLREADLLARPEKWHGYYGDRPTFVFTTRELPRPAGVDVRFMAGRPEDALAAIRAAAAGGDIWRVGGGDLAGQFLDSGALDQIDVSLTPVTLTAGAPLLSRRIDQATERCRPAGSIHRGQLCGRASSFEPSVTSALSPPVTLGNRPAIHAAARGKQKSEQTRDELVRDPAL
jgi:dihydrofolate reductase